MKPECLCLRTTNVSTLIDTTFLEEILAASAKDPFVLDIQQRRSNNIEESSHFRVEDNLLYFEECLYVPSESCLSLLQARHDLPAVGHFGFNKTLELVSWDFWWPQMWKTIKEYVLFYNICSRSKNPQHWPYGLLQPLLVPKRPWSSISMDFIVDLPPSNSFDYICVVVDRFPKMAHFVPCKKTITSEDTAKLFIDNIYRYHGLLDDIVSDRGPQFVSKF